MRTEYLNNRKKKKNKNINKIKRWCGVEVLSNNEKERCVKGDIANENGDLNIEVIRYSGIQEGLELSPMCSQPIY